MCRNALRPAVSSLATRRLAVWPPPEAAQLKDRFLVMHHTRMNSEEVCTASLAPLWSCSARFINTYSACE